MHYYGQGETRYHGGSEYSPSFPLIDVVIIIPSSNIFVTACGVMLQGWEFTQRKHFNFSMFVGFPLHESIPSMVRGRARLIMCSIHPGPKWTAIQKQERMQYVWKGNEAEFICLTGLR